MFPEELTHNKKSKNKLLCNKSQKFQSKKPVTHQKTPQNIQIHAKISKKKIHTRVIFMKKLLIFFSVIIIYIYICTLLYIMVWLYGFKRTFFLFAFEVKYVYMLLLELLLPIQAWCSSSQCETRDKNKKNIYKWNWLYQLIKFFVFCLFFHMSSV